MYNSNEKWWLTPVVIISIWIIASIIPDSNEPSFLLEMVDKLNSPPSIDAIDDSEMSQEQQEESTKDFPAFGECDSFCTIDRMNRGGDLTD